MRLARGAEVGGQVLDADEVARGERTVEAIDNPAQHRRRTLLGLIAVDATTLSSSAASVAMPLTCRLLSSQRSRSTKSVIAFS
jgi:hypothetical protein